jgi:hypothetical protein
MNGFHSRFWRSSFTRLLFWNFLLNLSNSIENVVSLADLGLVIEPSAHCSKYIISVDIASICNIVNCNAWMHKHPECIRPYTILSQYLIISDDPIFISNKWCTYTYGNFFLIDSHFTHILLWALLIKSAFFCTMVYIFNCVMKPFIDVRAISRHDSLIHTFLSEWLEH